MTPQFNQPQPGLDADLNRLELPRRGVELGALSLSDGAERTRVVSINLSSHQFATHLVNDLGAFITAFSHREKSYVVRFATHGQELSVLPAGNEESGIANNQHRLFVSTVPTDLGNLLLTPFSGTGLPRLLTMLAVQHVLATTGHANAHVRFAQIRNVLEKCGLTESWTRPIPQPERLEAEAVGRERVSKGFQYDYDSAIMLKDIVVMGRSISKAERGRCQHWDLSSHFRLIGRAESGYREISLPRR